jgi:outer membrane receptor protein involved in Fe transport
MGYRGKRMKFATSLLLLLLAISSRGQTSGTITGNVVDEHGAAIPNATVRCGNGAATATADAEGKFSLNCSSRSITVGATGCATLTQSLTAGTTITLHPSSVAATVQVTRAETKLSNTPASVVSMGRRELETSGSLTLDDRLRQVPGFTLFRRAGSSTANPTAQGVSLRGVGASGASRALVLNEGVPLNDPFGGWIYWGRVPQESIAAVELIRGPSSDLYGSSAVGGVISIVGRESSTARFADLDLAYANERSPFASFFGGFGSGSFRGSLAAEMFRTDGFVPTAPESRGPVDTLANASRYSLRPRFEYHRGTSTTLFIVSSLYQERRRNGSPLQNNDTRLADVVLGIDTSRKRGTFSARLYGSTEKYHQSFSAIAANRKTESLNRLQTVPSQALGATGQWTRSFNKHVVFAGADVRQIRGRSDETAIANGVATSLSTSGGRETTFGSFAGAILQLKSITASGGVRDDGWWNTRGYSATRPITTGTASLTAFRDRFESRVSPRVSVLARLTPHVSVSGVFSTAFRQPTLNELYRSFRVGNVLTLANDALTAERATDLEGAVIISGLNERLYVRAGPFCTRIANTVSNVTLTTTPSLITRQRQNLGSTRSCGLESDLRFDPSNELSLSTSYLFVDSVVRSMPGNAPLVGLELPQVARNVFTASMRFSPPEIGTFSAQFRTSSSQWDDDLNTLRLAPYATLDLFASRRLSGRATVYVAVENVTNERIESGRTPVLTLAQPRSLRAGVHLALRRR